MHDGSAGVVLALAILLVGAKLAGELAVRLRQPPVVAELCFGVLLGNLPLLGITGLDPILRDPGLDLLSRVGVLLLIFEVGLHSTVGQMLKVGSSALLVALVGVAAPMVLGWGVAEWLEPNGVKGASLFVGAALCATSIGITARVLKDLGRDHTVEARVVLGAAVIDDVLGVIVLSVVSGLGESTGGGISVKSLAWVTAKATLFLVIALGAGVRFAPFLFRSAVHLRSRDVLLTLGLALCFLFAWVAEVIGLAPIVGAFAAGLLLEDSYYKRFMERGEPSLEETLHPISAFLVPIFFVLMGVQTDLRAFASPRTLALAGALTVCAVVGKMLCSLAVVQRGVDRIAVGAGMLPRGEVGLIFANVGAGLVVEGQRIVPPHVYSALVAMILVTSMITPSLLKWRLGGARR
jgi:Kef-type K+ transport system membrane component KefB